MSDISNVTVGLSKTMRCRPMVTEKTAYLFVDALQICFHGDVDTQLDAISVLKIALEKLQDEIAVADGRAVA